MSKHKYTTALCLVIVAAMLITAVAFMVSVSKGMVTGRNESLYAQKLFSTNIVHKIDINVKESDWDDMLVNAQKEEYIQGSVVIDGETTQGVGIRPKGNSSLAMIANSDSDRYSFKIEFDHYQKGKSYFGLDKLVLNNIAQDNTYMKDYVTYQMMNAMGVDAPLSSFIWVTVNGEDWGLYLAAESVEESFAQRVYGSDFGEIYKPDSMDMGDMQRNMGGEQGQGNFPGGAPMPDFNGENGEMPQRPNDGEGERPNFGNGGMLPEQGGQGPNMGGVTSLVYSDDDPGSYAAIFDNAVFDTSKADKERLIKSLKQLNEGENIEQVLDVDEVIRYFVVHNFVLNSDSYTGSLTHNYYLAENDGKLSMIAWDYNLAFGGMGGLGGMFRGENTEQRETTTTDTATTLVNYPIDSPMHSGSTDDKPMIAWIFANEEYLAKYHEVIAEYMEYFNSGEFAKMYDNAITLISPYVEKEPSAFCTYEDFLKGSSALSKFCLLRAESISGQLAGTISSTKEGQTASVNAGFVDASGVDIECMGSNSGGFGRARGGQLPVWNRNGPENSDSSVNDESETLTKPGADSFMPPKGQGGFPDNNNFAQQDRQDPMKQDPMKQNEANNAGGMFPAVSFLSINEMVLLLVCIVVLVGGIVFARKRGGMRWGK